MTYLLFDIGGTKTRVATGEDLKTFCEPIKFKTPRDSFEDGIKLIAKAARELAGEKEIVCAAGGIRGLLNEEHTSLGHDTKLIHWMKKPFVNELKKVLNLEHVWLENDAALGGLGEAHFGAGKGYDIVAYHTVSTGVGGVRIDNGAIDAASVGFEPGKQAIDKKGTRLEDVISGTALEKKRGVKPYEIPQDDPVWRELAETLALGLKNTIVYWSPDIIVLGGSMICGDPKILNKDIVEATEKVLGNDAPMVPIVSAKLGDNVGLYGAMILIEQNLQKSN